MNPIIASLTARKSVRAFTDAPINPAQKDAILDAALQAPTAGNQILYTILDIVDPGIKQELSVLCDNQPFIAQAPLVLVFLADCQRWLDSYGHAGAVARMPGPGDLLLACSDALIAAQNTVVAAESLGIGSCYIGDILEHKEAVQSLLNLGGFLLPITMVIYGHPTEQQKARQKPARFDRSFIVQKNTWRPFREDEHRAAFAMRQGNPDVDYDHWVRAFCTRKYMSDFSLEMNRSVTAWLKAFQPGGGRD